MQQPSVGLLGREHPSQQAIQLLGRMHRDGPATGRAMLGFEIQP